MNTFYDLGHLARAVYRGRTDTGRLGGGIDPYRTLRFLRNGQTIVAFRSTTASAGRSPPM